MKTEIIKIFKKYYFKNKTDILNPFCPPHVLQFYPKIYYRRDKVSTYNYHLNKIQFTDVCLVFNQPTGF